jgi:hypothetical protein
LNGTHILTGFTFRVKGVYAGGRKRGDAFAAPGWA